MKTVVIWDECNGELKFFVTDLDLKHLNNKYVNSEKTSEEETEEISYLVYDASGNSIVELELEFPTQAVRDGAQVITMGFLP